MYNYKLTSAQLNLFNVLSVNVFYNLITSLNETFEIILFPSKINSRIKNKYINVASSLNTNI